MRVPDTLTNLPRGLVAPKPNAPRAGRRPYAWGVLFIALVFLIGARLSRTVPREVHLRYDLGDLHHEVLEARIGYHSDDQEVASVRFAYEDGAPASIGHRVSLPPGEYRLVADLRSEQRTRTFDRSLIVPTEGTLLYKLEEAAEGEGLFLRAEASR